MQPLNSKDWALYALLVLCGLFAAIGSVVGAFGVRGFGWLGFPTFIALLLGFGALMMHRAGRRNPGNTPEQQVFISRLPWALAIFAWVLILIDRVV